MKVACIGNMNNNFFTLMRYLRDLGVDAYLLMFQNELSHFTPENDTWDFDRWKPYIVKTNIINGGLEQYITLTKKDIQREFGGYDYYIGCGFTPAYFRKGQMMLNMFLPYATGIEYTFRYSKANLLDTVKERYEKRKQIAGLRYNTQKIVTIDQDCIRKSQMIGVPVEPLPIPMIYNNEEATAEQISPATMRFIEKFDNHFPVIFSHVSHFPAGSKTHDIKRNDILVTGFAEYMKIANEKDNPLLALIEYGPAVNETKNLIAKLKITKNVVWLPAMDRKNILLLLKHVDFGGGEFGGVVWGGTGWEFMSQGVPFLQFVDLNDEQFEKDTLTPFPPIFNSNMPSKIAETLQYYAQDKEQLKKAGKDLKMWYDSYSGQNLAKKYVNIINKSTAS